MLRLHLVTSIPYLARNELYKREKPYQIDHSVARPEGADYTNHEFDRRSVTVEDLRHCLKPTIKKNGFCILNAKTTLSADHATNERTPAMTKYLDEVEKLLYKEFPEYSRIEVLDWGVGFTFQSSLMQKLSDQHRFANDPRSFPCRINTMLSWSSSSLLPCRIPISPLEVPSFI